jgi:hypothetical protein
MTRSSRRSSSRLSIPSSPTRHAIAAAREAASVSAHDQALDLYRRAVRNLPDRLPVLERAEVLAALGDEAAATDRKRLPPRLT